MKKLTVFAILSIGALSACVPSSERPTPFIGAPFYPGGPQACFATCAHQNMEMSGFVYSGEFASSCVCRPHAQPAPAATVPAPAPQAQAADDVGDVATAAGVKMRTEQLQQEQYLQQQQRKRRHD